MRVGLDGETLTGRAVDLTGRGLDPDDVLAALREDRATVGGNGLQVVCPEPGPVHRTVGAVEPGMVVQRRAALAAAARSRGHRAPQAEEIATLEARLADEEVPDADTTGARKRLAAAGEERERLRERVARLQGRVQALREADADPAEAEAELAEAARRLSEVETERAAAEELLARERDRARAARDARERRLELEDRLANARRTAREHLADEVRAPFREAVAAAPGEASDPGEAAARTVALAVYRVAAVAAPVVLASAPFPDAAATADWLGAPVLEV
jgi:hypothetical protein